MKTLEVVLTIASILFAALFTVIQGLFFWILNKLDKRIEIVAKENADIKSNYIQQFKEVRQSIHETKDELKDEIRNEIRNIVDKLNERFYPKNPA